MSVPIQNKMEMSVELKDGYYSDMVFIQLNDGSVYMADPEDSMSIQPVSRSFFGGVTKKNMTSTISELMRLRAMRNAFVHDGYQSDAMLVNERILFIEQRVDDLKKLWRDFKGHSTKTPSAEQNSTEETPTKTTDTTSDVDTTNTSKIRVSSYDFPGYTVRITSQDK